MISKNKPLTTTFQDFQNGLSDLYDQNEAYQITHWVFEEKLGLNKVQMRTEKEQIPNDDSINELNTLLRRLKSGEPVQYVLGEIHFMGCRLFVNQTVMIPRPETEELADLIIRRHPQTDANILDIGTGSGCLAIALAKYCPGADVHAVEYTSNALRLARENAAINEANVQFTQQDIRNIPDLGHKWGLIVSNPPYILEEEKTAMHQNVLGFEPPEALFVPNEDPLMYYRYITNLAMSGLKDEGWLYFEINSRFNDSVERLLKGAGFQNTETKQDLYGKNRFVYGQWLL